MNGIYGEVTVNFSERDRKLFLHISELMEQLANAHNSEDLDESDSTQEKAIESARFLKAFCITQRCQQCVFNDSRKTCMIKTCPIDWGI